MKVTLIKLVVCCCVINLFACDKLRQHSFRNQSEMMTYISDERNGLSRSQKSHGGIETTVRFQPYDLIPGHDNQDSTLRNNIYFVMSFSADGKELLHQLSQEQYSAFSQLFSFNMQNYVKGVNDINELEVNGVFFSPTYNMGKANNLLLVFDREASLHGRQFEIVVDEFGLGLGKQSFIFNVTALKEGSNLEIIK